MEFRLFDYFFFSFMQILYVEVWMSRSLSERLLVFEIMRIDCINRFCIKYVDGNTILICKPKMTGFIPSKLQCASSTPKKKTSDCHVHIPSIVSTD